MSRLQNATTITLPAPTKGVSKKQPLADMSPQFSPWMLNVEARPQKLRVRNGIVVHSVVGSSANVLNLGTFGDKVEAASNKLFAYCQDGSGTNKIYDVTASAESLSVTLADDTADHAAPLNFAKRLAFASENDYADCSQVYDGSSWGSWGFTYSASPIGSDVCCSFKGRVYIFNGTSMYYGDLDAVTGATTLVDYQYVFKESSDIAWCGVMSSPGDRTDEVYLAFGNHAGEILIYSGDYPDSSTWSLIGQFQISPIRNKNSILVHDNDIWIFSTAGVTSLRDIFTKGSVVDEGGFSISSEIQPYWNSLISQAGTTLPVSAAFWPERNQVWILVAGYIDENDTFHSDIGTILVYDKTAESWSFFSLENVDASFLGNITYFLNAIYFSTSNVVMKVSSTVFKDEIYNSPGSYQAFDHAIHSAYTTFNNEQINKRIVGFEPILKTDFSGVSVGMRSVADMGRQISDAAKVELQDGFNTPQYSVGAQGTYLQWRMEGESDTASTDGLELFAVGAILTVGGTR